MVRIQDGMSVAVGSLRAGRLDEAQRACEQVLDQWPGHALSWHVLGVIEYQRGHYERAIKHLHRAVELEETREGWHFSLGVSYKMSGRLDDAITWYRSALKLNPRYADAHNNLGVAYLESGDRDQALACFKGAVDSNARHADARVNLGLLLSESGRAKDGLHHLRTAIRLRPKHADYYGALGRALYGQHELDQAARCYRRALRIDPRCALAHHGLGLVEQEQGEPQKALAHYRSALRMNATAESYRGAGTVLARLGCFDEAGVCFQRARQRQADDPETIAAEARMDEIRGRFDDAWGKLGPLVEAGNEEVSVIMVFAAISRHIDRQEEAIRKLRRLLDTSILEPRHLMPLHFALGKLLDEQGQYDDAFEHIRQANRLKRRSFDLAQHQRFIDAMVETFSPNALPKLPRASFEDDRPIFILGMPRSGTSLIEQIISSHSQVHGAGELRNMIRISETLAKRLSCAEAYPRCTARLTKHVADVLAQSYLDHLTRLAPDAVRVSDKMPGNFLHLGLIELLFPNARVIHCRRGPLDTCLSCYFQNFAGYHGYAYELEHLGGYYRQYERLMKHWQDVLEIPMMSVQYEQLINDPEPTIRAMLAFCALPWEPSCLRFHTSGRQVLTASYDQVRRPLYRTSVGRWRHYEKHLEPLQRALGDGVMGGWIRGPMQ